MFGGPGTQANKNPPWQTVSAWDSSGRQPPSPRPRSDSPRARPKGKGKEKGQNKTRKGKPAGKGKGKPDGKAARPDVAGLPQAPVPPALPAPAAPAGQLTGASSEAQTKLESLLATRRSSRDSLPVEIVSMLGDHEAAASQQKSKAMHRAISSQDKARKELIRVRDARRAYLASWTEYVMNLQKLLQQQQQQEQEKAMSEFAENETHWRAQLKEATNTLASLSGEPGSFVIPDSDEEKDSDMKTEKDSWSDGADLRQRQTELGTVLARVKERAENAAREAAAEGKDSGRDSSRTPRRGAKDADAEVPAKALA